uniref:Uncharacterized protein n=1 Tax=Cacopsylla melanoneura TaxID=428564 RepID=A0A8D9E7M8_9HEMI
MCDLLARCSFARIIGHIFCFCFLEESSESNCVQFICNTHHKKDSRIHTISILFFIVYCLAYNILILPMTMTVITLFVGPSGLVMKSDVVSETPLGVKFAKKCQVDNFIDGFFFSSPLTPCCWCHNGAGGSLHIDFPTGYLS